MSINHRQIFTVDSQCRDRIGCKGIFHSLLFRSEEGGFICGGRFEVADQRDEVGLVGAVYRGAEAQAHDPGAIALGAAGVQVHVE